MSPYRLLPTQPSVAPAAPWWRVAWAVLARGFRARLQLRTIRRSYRARLAAYEQMFYARDRLRSLRRADRNISNVPAVPLPGLGRSVFM